MEIYCKKQLIASQVQLADNFFSRFKGLMGKKDLEEGEGLLLKECSSIHCFFMKMPIDAVYLSDSMEVLFIETLKPWQIGKLVQGASHVLELGIGTSRIINIGDRLVLVDSI